MIIEAPKSEVSLTTLTNILKEKYPQYENFAIHTKDGLLLESSEVTEKSSYWLKSRLAQFLYMPRRGDHSKDDKGNKILKELVKSIEEESK